MNRAGSGIFKKICSTGISVVLSALCLFPGEPVTADNMSDLESRQAQLEQNKKKVEALLSEYEGKAEESEKYLEEYDNKMKIQEQQVENIRQQIEIFEADIAELEADIAQKQTEADEGIEKFGQRLRALYMAGNDSIASVIIGSTDFYDMLARVEFVERISKQDNDLISSLKEQISGIEDSKTKLQDKLDDLEAKKAQEEKLYEELRETYNNHIETKQMHEKMIADYQERYDEIQAEQQQVEEELQAEIRKKQKELEEQRQAKAAEEALKKQKAEENGTEYVPEPTPPAYSETGFIWPVPTVRNVNASDGYGERWITEESRKDFHKGIDITKPGCAGEAVVASAGGTVIQAGDKHNGYGECVIIDHGNGISTLYAHNEKVAVSVGDTVTQGQVIAYIGQTGYAHGYHSHFEVRIDGQHTDPFKYVNINN